VEEIVKEIEDFQGLEALRLEGNTIGVEAAQAIAKALETKRNFKVGARYYPGLFIIIIFYYYYLIIIFLYVLPFFHLLIIIVDLKQVS